MNIRPRLRNIIFLQILRVLYSLTGLTIFAFSLIISGCNLRTFEKTSRYEETKFILDSTNFETGVVHATGEASCFYILLSIPVCKHQNIATIAWDKMRHEAQMEGKPAQLVNVFEDHSVRWNFLYIFYQEHYMVSANVIVYKQANQ